MDEEIKAQAFWHNINQICAAEFSETKAEFKNSTILQALYNDATFTLPAHSFDQIQSLTPLELHMLIIKGRLDFSGFKKEDVSQTPPQLTYFYLKSESFPEILKAELQTHAIRQNVAPLPEKEEEEEEFNVKQASQQDIEIKLREKLQTGAFIPEEWIDRLYALASQNNQNYVYIQFFSSLGLTNKSYNVPEDNLSLGFFYFPEKIAKNLKYLRTVLDKDVKFSNNPVSVYEKHLVFSKDREIKLIKKDDQSEQDFWVGWQKEAQSRQYIGLSFLLALHTAQKIEEKTSDNALYVISSLSTVGLIDKTRQFSREYFAEFVGMKEGE
ncbi:MAG: hypothetical protein AAF988_00740 [Pseudomonadota bacterium]